MKINEVPEQIFSILVIYLLLNTFFWGSIENYTVVSEVLELL